MTFRSFTSATIKSDIKYEEFLYDTEGPELVLLDPQSWCSRYVDPLGKDAGQFKSLSPCSAILSMQVDHPMT